MLRFYLNSLASPATMGLTVSSLLDHYTTLVLTFPKAFHFVYGPCTVLDDNYGPDNWSCPILSIKLIIVS